MFKKLIVVLICFVFITACKFSLPTSSDSLDNTERNDNAAKAWDPYVVVHAFACDAGIQQPHLLKLIQAGALRGVRMGDLGNPEIQRFARWFQGQGVEILGIFNNEYLRNPNVCQIFSQHVAQNPGVFVWEIGNEVSGFAAMNSEEYMRIATPLFYYVKKNHPNVRLAIGAVAGNGSSADDLRRMIDAGLNKLCQDGLEVVPIHFYSWNSTRLAEFQSQVARLPIFTRIWITETNDLPPNWSTQTGYVAEMYPKLRSALRAERIYWYVFSEPSDFSLVTGLADSGQVVVYSPLMNLLIGAGNTNLSVSDAALDNFGVSPEILPDMTPRLPPGMNRDADKPSRHNPRERRSQ